MQYLHDHKARMVELVDTLVSGTSARKGMEVRVFFRANSYIFKNSIGTLEYPYTSSEYRNKGYGKRLMLFNFNNKEEHMNKKILILLVCMILVPIANLFAGGSFDEINEAMENSSDYQITEGIKKGQELFIQIIIEMEKNNEKNYNIEHIINNYLGYIEPFINVKEYKTTCDWIYFISDDRIVYYQQQFKTLLNLLEKYLIMKEGINYE